MKKRPCGASQRATFGEGARPVAQVLEHLHRHDAIEALVAVEAVDVGGEYLDVAE